MTMGQTRNTYSNEFKEQAIAMLNSGRTGTIVAGELGLPSGWLYLCAILDLANREVIGWSMLSHLGTDTLLNAYWSVVQSMSRKGDCWDNAPAESFFKTLRSELIISHVYRTRAEAQYAIFEYIEVFYNRVRRHSYLGCLTPLEYKSQAA